jgi:DNA replication protein DnaC
VALVTSIERKDQKPVLNEPTIEKLHALRLGSMAEAWQAQQRDTAAGALGFDERFAMLVDAEFLARDNRRLARLLKDAELRIPGACLEDVDAGAGRGVDRAMLRQLASCAWIGEHLNVLVSGATGVGKSYLASALGQSACRRGLRVLYRRVPRLFDEIALSRADGSYARLLARLAKADLLILDDLGLGTPTEAHRHDLLEVLEDRYGRSSTVVTSQLPVEKWHEWIGDPTLADAVLDRLVHNAYKLGLKGPSKRKEKNTTNNG